MKGEKFKIGRKIISRLTKKPPVLLSPYHVIIWQLIKNPDDFSGIDWSRETLAAKELYGTYPNVDFWGQLNLGFYLNSLNFFKGKDGVKYLNQAINKFESSSRLDLGDTPAEEFDNAKTFDKKINSKPLTLKDFLKNGKKTK
tara:strand:- start:201 stop:626 length:426 start_codon:yes stop_codon:yes gene_type:complete